MSGDKVIRGDGEVSMEGHVNAAHYDELSRDYDRQLVEWGYDAPEQGAQLLAANLDDFGSASILDCGCGTGMTGQAIRSAGAKGSLTGADLSQESLGKASQKNVYDELVTVDLNAPLSFSDDSFDAVLCIAVLSYVEAEPVFREWTRIVRPGGTIVFSCREDFFATREYPAVIERLEREGLWTRVEVTDVKPYLPDHAEFAEAIGVIYGCFKAA